MCALLSRFGPRHSDPGIAALRLQFLASASSIPESLAMLNSLFDPETIRCADICFGMSKMADASPELEERIEDWAVRNHLARPPVRESWIFRIAVRKVADRVCGPSMSEDECHDGEMNNWATVGVTLFHPELGYPDQLTYKFETFNPAVYSATEYLKRQIELFKEFLAEHVAGAEAVLKKSGFRSVRPDIEPKKMEWLVRYQMLGETFAQISARMGRQDMQGTIRATVLKLQKRIGLPGRQGRGRPKKK
jgi:hypothetical protein